MGQDRIEGVVKSGVDQLTEKGCLAIENCIFDDLVIPGKGLRDELERLGKACCKTCHLVSDIPVAGRRCCPRGASQRAGSIDLSRVRKAFASVLSELSMIFSRCTSLFGEEPRTHVILEDGPPACESTSISFPSSSNSIIKEFVIL